MEEPKLQASSVAPFSMVLLLKRLLMAGIDINAADYDKRTAGARRRKCSRHPHFSRSRS